MVVTPYGIVMIVMPVQLSNAQLPILVTVYPSICDGIVMSVSLP